MRDLILTVILVYTTAIPCVSQTSPKNDELKFNADYFLMRNEFSKALDIYLKVLDSEPENADIQYRIGICYLNAENEKSKAIPYLSKASQNVSTKYSTNSFKESHAPVETFFLLGSAYRVNNQLDQAIEAYEQYKTYLSSGDRYNREVTDQYIHNCRQAREMISHPRKVDFKNLGRPVNDEKANYNPAISGDGKVLVYTSPSKQGYDVFMSTFNDTAWSAPKNISPYLGGGKYLRTSSLSYDGNILVLDMEDPENAELYISYFKKGRWTKAEPMPKPINTKMNETNGSFSPDGNTFYFTSNRKGGEGDLDIYRCILQNGVWSDALNIGATVNTPFNEESPFVSGDDKTLFFSSEGHEGMGGFDVYSFDLTASGKGVQNLGYPVNSTDNNLFYVPINDGLSGFYAFTGADSYGGRDIYEITIEKPPEPAPAAIEPEVAATVSPDTSVGPRHGVAIEEASVNKMPVAVEEASVITDTSVGPRHGVAVEEKMPNNVPIAVAEATANYVTETPGTAKSYTVQFIALRKPVDLRYFNGMNDISVTLSRDAWYRYTFPATTDSLEAARLRTELIGKGFTDAFIRRKNIHSRYTIQVMAVPGPVTDLNRFSDLTEITAMKGRDHFCRYTTGVYKTREDAQADLAEIKTLGYPKAFIRKVRSLK